MIFWTAHLAHLSNRFQCDIILGYFGTAHFMKKVPVVYTHLMETICIYLSQSAQVAAGIIFRKSPRYIISQIKPVFLKKLFLTLPVSH